MDGIEQTPVVTLTHQQALSYAHVCGQMLCLGGCVMQYAMYHMLRLYAQKTAWTAATTAAGHHCRHVVHCSSPTSDAHIVQEAIQECMHLTVGEDVLNECMNAHIKDKACHVFNPQSC